MIRWLAMPTALLLVLPAKASADPRAISREQIDAIVEQALAAFGVPGMSVTVVQAGARPRFS